MCELHFFSHFFRERFFESRQNSRVDLFKAKKKKNLEGFKQPFFIYCSWVLCSMDCLQLPFIRVKEAVSWTQNFLTRKFGPKIEVYLWQTNLKAIVCKNSTFQVNRKKNGTGRRRLTSRVTSIKNIFAIKVENKLSNWK